MKFFAVYIFAIVAYASAASIPQYDGPTYELKHISERDAHPEAYPEGYPEAYADGYADAIGNAVANPNAYAVANAVPNAAGQPHPNGVAFADDDDYNRSRRFTCDVLSVQTAWFSTNHAACALRCLAQRRRGGRCENGVCICR
nr:defensin-like [Megalopta genalis]